MNELWAMFQRGAGIGAWVVGFAVVVTVAMPVYALMTALIGWVLRGGRRKGSDGE